jgi:hypothetical protein
MTNAKAEAPQGKSIYFLYKGRLNVYIGNWPGAKRLRGPRLLCTSIFYRLLESQMVQSFGQAAPEGILLPAIPYSMVQPGFILNLNAFVLPMRGKRLEGNKESRYEGREVFIGFFSFYLYLKVNAGALGSPRAALDPAAFFGLILLNRRHCVMGA